MTMTDLSATLDPGTLRRAFGAFPSGVVAVAAEVDGRPVGLAASSFTSVSLEPALVSFSVANGSATWPVLRSAGHLGLSVLADHHDAVCTRLAGPAEHRFDGLDLHTTADGAVLLEDAVAAFDCTVHREIEAGTTPSCCCGCTRWTTRATPRRWCSTAVRSPRWPSPPEPLRATSYDVRGGQPASGGDEGAASGVRRRRTVRVASHTGVPTTPSRSANGSRTPTRVAVPVTNAASPCQPSASPARKPDPCLPSAPAVSARSMSTVMVASVVLVGEVGLLRLQGVERGPAPGEGGLDRDDLREVLGPVEQLLDAPQATSLCPDPGVVVDDLRGHVLGAEGRVVELGDRLQVGHRRLEVGARHPQHQPGVRQVAVVGGRGLLLGNLPAVAVRDGEHVAAGGRDVGAVQLDRAGEDDGLGPDGGTPDAVGCGPVRAATLERGGPARRVGRAPIPSAGRASGRDQGGEQDRGEDGSHGDRTRAGTDRFPDPAPPDPA